MRPPNVLVFFTDQQRADTCGCYGQKLPVTPNLDRMAKSGVRFERAYTPQPVCGPARACLQTGRYATATGCFINGVSLPREEPTVAKALGAAGYETAYIGKWHLASDRDGAYREAPVPPERRGGYEYWLAADVLEMVSHSYDGHVWDGEGNQREFPEGRYRADVLGDWTLEWLEQRNWDRPFFLFLSFIEPHHQNDHERYEGPYGSRERFAAYEVPPDLAGRAGDWQEEYPDYLGCCWALDQNLGRIRKWLVDGGLSEDTLLIYTSDHGSHFRTRNPEYKRSCHEASLRVPLVIEGPGFRGGKTVEDLVSLIDLPPTILETAEMEPFPTMRGRGLAPLVAGQVEDWRQEIFAQISEDHVGRTLRTERWKYEVWVPSAERWSGVAQGSSEVYHEYHLYDLETDPYEGNDLVSAPAYAEVRAELAERLKRRMVEAEETEPTILPA